jgi:flagellar biogenesis protein FliO
MAASPKPTSKFGFWTPWVVVAAVAVLAGLLLPQLLPGETVLEKNQSKTETKTKSTGEYTAPALPEMPNPQAMLGRLFLGTIFVLGLAVVSLWGVRRWMQFNGPANNTPREMRLIETLQLGNRCSMHLVKLGKREVLIAVDGAGIKTVVPLAASFEDALADESGVRGQESGVRDQESGVRDQESGHAEVTPDP